MSDEYEMRRAFNAALIELPAVPTMEVLDFLMHAAMNSRSMNFWERGKALQRERHPIPYKTEYECAAGLWDAIRAGVLQSREDSRSIDQLVEDFKAAQGRLEGAAKEPYNEFVARLCRALGLTDDGERDAKSLATLLNHAAVRIEWQASRLPRWLNVESSVLPDPGVTMLGWRADRGIALCYYVERPEGFRMWTWNGHSGGGEAAMKRDTPTHWMPMPDEPNSERIVERHAPIDPPGDYCVTDKPE